MGSHLRLEPSQRVPAAVADSLTRRFSRSFSRASLASGCVVAATARPRYDLKALSIFCDALAAAIDRTWAANVSLRL